MSVLQTFLRPGHAAPANLFGLTDNVLRVFQGKGCETIVSLAEARSAADKFVGAIRADPERVFRERLGTDRRSYGPRLREFHRSLFRGMDPDDWRLDPALVAASKNGKNPSDYFHRLTDFLGIAVLGGQEFMPPDPEGANDRNFAYRESLLHRTEFVHAFGALADFVCDEAEAIDPLYGLMTLHAAVPLLAGLRVTGSNKEDCFHHLLHFVWLHQMENYWAVPTWTVADPAVNPLTEALGEIEGDVRQGALTREILVQFRSQELYELGYFLRIYLKSAKIPASDRLLMEDVKTRFTGYARFLAKDDTFLSHDFLARTFACAAKPALIAKKREESPLSRTLSRLARVLEAAAGVADADGEREREIFRWTAAEWIKSLEVTLRRSPPDKVAARIDDEAANLETRLRRLTEDSYATAVFEKEPSIFQSWGR